VNNELYGVVLEEFYDSCELEGAYFWDATAQDWTEIAIDEPLDFLPRADLVGRGIGVVVNGDCIGALEGVVDDPVVVSSGGDSADDDSIAVTVVSSDPESEAVEEIFVRVGGGGGFRPAPSSGSSRSSGSSSRSVDSPSFPPEIAVAQQDPVAIQEDSSSAQEASGFPWGVLLYALIVLIILGGVALAIIFLRRPLPKESVGQTSFPKVIPLQAD
jgi:hypothetical protein